MAGNTNRDVGHNIAVGHRELVAVAVILNKLVNLKFLRNCSVKITQEKNTLVMALNMTNKFSWLRVFFLLASKTANAS